MEFHFVKQSLFQAIPPISKDLESIVMTGAALDAAKMGKRDWVGIGEANAGSPLGFWVALALMRCIVRGGPCQILAELHPPYPGLAC